MLPQLNCFVSALNGDGCSSLTDFACHCQKPQLVRDITPCVKKACAVSDQICECTASFFTQWAITKI